MKTDKECKEIAQRLQSVLKEFAEANNVFCTEDLSHMMTECSKYCQTECSYSFEVKGKIETSWNLEYYEVNGYSMAQINLYAWEVEEFEDWANSNNFELE